MNPRPHEWVEKAEADLVTARREYRARKHPNYDATCFHAQQCVEKYIKGCLEAQGVDFPKTHDLIQLTSLLPAGVAMTGLREGMARLSAYAALTIDHVIPKSKGGTDAPDNLVVACHSCNLYKRIGLVLVLGGSQRDPGSEEG